VTQNDGNDDEPAERTEVVTYEETRRRAQASSTPKQLGRYRLDGVIAQGGMAEIWLATVEGPGRFQKKVVVKRIRPSLVKQAHAQAGKHAEMFVREAQLLARLDHKNIVAVLELGVESAMRVGEPDEHYIVMERLEGLTLRDVALRSWQAGRALPVELVVRFVADACLGLDHAHNLKDDRGQPANLVHRDISPDNLFVTRAGVTKLLDFGIAKREDMATLTTTGELKGKVPYMTPEQLTGARLDARTDLFAVGVVLYWLLCGRRPFDGPNDIFTMKAILDDPPRPVRELNPAVPPLLADVVMACLEKDPARRIGSAAALHDTLSVLLYGLTGTPPDPVAFVAAVEALPSSTYELVPDVAATCAQRWPGPVPAAPSTSMPPAVRDARDASQANTMQMPLDNARLQPVRVAPVESRRIPAAPVSSGVDFDDAPTLPPASYVGSTADGPAAGPRDALVGAPRHPGRHASVVDTAPDTAAPVIAAAVTGVPVTGVPATAASLAADARLAEEPTVVRRAPLSPPPSVAPSSTPAAATPSLSSSLSPALSSSATPLSTPAWRDRISAEMPDTIELSVDDPRLGLAAADTAARDAAAFSPSMTLPEFPSPAALIAAAEANPPTSSTMDELAPAPAPTPRSRTALVLAVVGGGVLAAVVVVVVVVALWRRGGDAAQQSPPPHVVEPTAPLQVAAVGTDAGAVVTDAGAVVTDAGAVVVDAGAVVTDAGTVVTDAGTSVDAGAGAAVDDDNDARPSPATPAVDPRKAGALVVRARPGTRVVVDDRFVGVTPLRAVTLKAGPHEVRLGFRGVRSKHKVDVVAGRIVVLRGEGGGR
jgi:serine/threonine-protein kinase